jgi:hypothetical protein
MPLPGIEPGLPESQSEVLTVILHTVASLSISHLK